MKARFYSNAKVTERKYLNPITEKKLIKTKIIAVAFLFENKIKNNVWLYNTYREFLSEKWIVK